MPESTFDDAAEQDGLGELRGGEQEIGKRQQPAQPRLLAEQFENAGVKAENGHADRQLGRITGPVF
ncbi:hypothetical protein AB7M41_002627 [Bradyrhizobium diazoefficiens]